MNGPVPVLLMANFANRVGGGEESFLDLVRTIDRCRFGAHAHVPADGDLAAELRRGGVPVAVWGLPPLRPWTVLAGRRAVRNLGALLSERRIALIHPHGTRAALYAVLAARRLQLPVVWHVRIADRDPWVDRFLLGQSSAVIANSVAAAARFHGRPGALAKVHVIPNGVDLNRFRPGAPDADLKRAIGVPADHHVVLYVGRMEQGKGPDLFLQAARRIYRTLPQTSFLLVGDGPMRPGLEAQARAGNLPAAFVGYQPDPLSFFRLATVLVVPSRQEAFGRVLIEAMAAEVPVVATRVGGIPEICHDGQTALLVPPANPDALASAVVATLTDPDATRVRVRAAAADVRARFDLARHAERVQELYAAVLAPRVVDAIRG